MAHLFSAACLALALVSSAALTPASAAGSEPSHFTLENGMEVVVIPDHRTPVVTHMVWYRVGSADETAGESGLAHFLEHLMFKGTPLHPMGYYSQLVARVGGQENAFTSTDYTAYYQRVSRDRLPQLMELEADRMTNLVLTDAVVKPELDVVLEEQNQRVGNEPTALLGEQVNAALYLNHPYGRPVIGWRKEIEKLDREHALAFYKRFYTPNNAILVVAGDVEPEEIRSMAQATYGKVAPRAAIAPRIRAQEPDPVAVRHLTVADARVAQPSMTRSYLVPSATTAAPREAEAIDVLTHILGSGSTSRLYRRLVVERGVASTVGAYYLDTALDPTRLAISATPAAGGTLEPLEAALDEAIAEVLANGVTADELERAKSRMVADWVYSQDSQMTLARIYGAALATGSTVEKVQSWSTRIRSVTAEEVSAAARRWLDKRRSVTGYLVREAQPEGKRS